MPRKKAETEEAQAPVSEMPGTDEALMERYFALKDWLEGETKRFSAYIEPHKNMMTGIEQEFLKRLNDRGADSTKSDYGTAYKSTLLNVSISPEAAPYKSIDRDAPMLGRDALLEFALDHWEAYGSDMLIISAQKDSVRKYMEENGGQPPPGVKTAFHTRVNLRRS